MATHFFGLNDRTFRYRQTIGQQGYQGPGFYQLTDLAIGQDGAIYVANRSVPEVGERHKAGVRVVITNLDEEFLGEFGGYGEEDGKFIRPTAVAVDHQQNVYVTDEWLQRVSVFDKGGKFLHKWGKMGSADGEFNRASGLTFDKDDNVYLVDSANHRVQVFTREGKFLSKFGSEGRGEGQFNLPWGITIDQKGDLYVADWRNDRVQKLGPDGKFLGAFGSSGDLVGQFNRPVDVAVDKDGDIYVVDWLNHRVQVFTPKFRYITHLLGDATMSKWAEQRVRSNPGHMRMYGLVRDMGPLQRFWYPVGVDVDEQGRVVVADSARFRLQVYQKGEMLLADIKDDLTPSPFPAREGGSRGG